MTREGSRCRGAPLFIRPSAQVFAPLRLQQPPLRQRHAQSVRHYLTVFYLDFPLKGTSEQSSLTLPSAHRGSRCCSWKYKTNISLSEKGIYLGDKQADGVVCGSETNRAALGGAEGVITQRDVKVWDCLPWDVFFKEKPALALHHSGFKSSVTCVEKVWGRARHSSFSSSSSSINHLPQRSVTRRRFSNLPYHAAAEPLRWLNSEAWPGTHAICIRFLLNRWHLNTNHYLCVVTARRAERGKGITLWRAICQSAATARRVTNKQVFDE